MAISLTVKTKAKICRRLTPANDAEFQYVAANVRVKYFHQSDVHVNRFQPHPGKGGEEEEVQQGRDGDAETLHLKWGHPAVQEEAEVQEQQRSAQVHQDFGGIIPSQFSRKGKSKINGELILQINLVNTGSKFSSRTALHKVRENHQSDVAPRGEGAGYSWAFGKLERCFKVLILFQNGLQLFMKLPIGFNSLIF